MAERISQELEAVKKYYLTMEVNQQNTWAKIPDYKLPKDIGWNKEVIPLCFNIPDGYPGSAPYGIYVPSDIRINGSIPDNFTVSVNNKPPFDGEWGIFSWVLDPWQPSAEILKGSNLLNFIQSFYNRFLQGK